MYCDKCGAKINDSAKFCPECGNAIDVTKVQRVSSDAAKTDDTVNRKENTENKESAPKNAGKLLYTAERSVWAAGKKIIGFSTVAVIFLILAIACFAGAEGTDDEVALMIGFGVFALLPVIICIAVLVFSILVAKSYKIEVYSNRLVVRSGVISKKVKQSVMTPIVGVEIEQSVSGRLWNYGYVYIDKVGIGWDVDSHYIKNPVAFKEFLETLIDDKAVDKLQMHIMN